MDSQGAAVYSLEITAGVGYILNCDCFLLRVTILNLIVRHLSQPLFSVPLWKTEVRDKIVKYISVV